MGKDDLIMELEIFKVYILEWKDVFIVLTKTIFSFIFLTLLVIFYPILYIIHKIIRLIADSNKNVFKFIDNALNDDLKDKSNLTYLNDLLEWVLIHKPKRLAIINYIKEKIREEKL